MSNLQKLIENARLGLSLQEKISDDGLLAIAKQCGALEIEEIKQRIARLQIELETVEEWDGDTQDDIHFAIFRLSRLLRSAEAR